MRAITSPRPPPNPDCEGGDAFKFPPTPVSPTQRATYIDRDTKRGPRRQSSGLAWDHQAAPALRSQTSLHCRRVVFLARPEPPAPPLQSSSIRRGVAPPILPEF